MLNRFKNALYGSSQVIQDNSSTARVEYDYREAVIGKRIRSALTRSSSFREDLLSEANRSRNNDSSSTSSINSAKSRAKDLNSPRSSNIDSTESSLTSREYSIRHLQHFRPTKAAKFQYSRPEFLQLKTEDEILVSADHQIRPIILPRDISRLPWKSGYAECINAGKSERNEDQAACYHNRILLTKKSSSPLSSGSSSPSSSPGSNNCSKTDPTFIDTTSTSSSCASELPWVYFGLFDGHAGPSVAVAAAAQLHRLIEIKLNQIADLLVSRLEWSEKFDVLVERFSDTIGESEIESNGEADKLQSLDELYINNNNNTSAKSISEVPILDKQQQVEIENSTHLNENHINDVSHETSKTSTSNQELKSEVEQARTKQESASVNIVLEKQLSHLERSMIDTSNDKITVDSLIIGALESSFWEMDAMIARDKNDYKMPGGCTAIVSLFILGKLYVCNAGDSRAVVCKDNQVIPMSFDFTPTSEKERILRLGLQHPEFLGNEFTQLEFIRRPLRKDIGKMMLYRDAYMTGWSMKTITHDDLKFPLVWGGGKRSRVLATIGVTRGFGDHELRAQYGSVLIKPFLTPEPEVRVLPLEHDEHLTPEDVLIMGSDGLWDVTTNQKAADIVKNSFFRFPDNEESRSKYRYITAAQDLVIHSRGETGNWSNVWRMEGERLASLDDIAVFVIPLKQYRDEYLEWKKLRSSS